AVRSSDFSVFVDGALVRAGPELPLLVAEPHGWLVDVLALTMDLKATALNRQTENTIRDAVERFRMIRLGAGTRVHVVLDGDSVNLPSYLPPVLAVPHDEFPVIAFRGSAEPLTWATLELLSPVIAGLVGQAWSGAELRAAVTTLGRPTATDEVIQPTDADYSLTFGHDVRRIANVRRAQRGYLDDMLFRLR